MKRKRKKVIPQFPAEQQEFFVNSLREVLGLDPLYDERREIEDEKEVASWL